MATRPKRPSALTPQERVIVEQRTASIQEQVDEAVRAQRGIQTPDRPQAVTPASTPQATEMPVTVPRQAQTVDLRSERMGQFNEAVEQGRLIQNYFDIVERVTKYGPEAAESALMPGEAADFSPEAIATQNALEARDRADVQRLGVRGGVWGRNTVRLKYGSAAGNRALLPTDLRTQQDKDQFMLSNFPTLAALQRQTGLSDSEIKDSTNFTIAVDAARRILSTPNDQRRTELLKAMPVTQQALVLDVVDGIIEKAKEAQDAAEQEPNYIQKALKFLGIPVTTIFDALLWANEQTQHGLRAGIMRENTGKTFTEAWDQTEAGVYNEDGIAWARRTYGDKPVDIILELRRGALNGEDDVIGKAIKRYEGDEEALRLIDQLVNGVETDREMLDLATYIDSLDQGSTKNFAGWFLGGVLQGIDTPASGEAFEWANTRLFTAYGTSVDLASQVALDPTLIAGKIHGIYKASRYGLNFVGDSAAMGARLEKVFATKGVRNYFDNVLGPQLQAVSRETDIGRKAQMFNSVSAQNRRFFKPEALAMMEKYGVSDAASALRFFDEGDHVTAIFLGQGARRASQIVVPHMTTANVKFKIAGMAVRGATWDRAGSARWIDGVFGAGTADEIAATIRAVNLEEQAGTLDAAQASAARTDIVQAVQDRLAAALSQRGADRAIGEFLSDFQFADGEAKRTFIRRLMDRTPVVGENLNAATRGTGKRTPFWYAMARYGYKKRGDGFASRERLERISRLMSRRPDTAMGLYIADGRDADVVRQIFLAGGVNPYWSNFAKYLWVHSNEAQRKIAASGIARTYGYATGLHVVDPDLGVSEIGRMAEAVGQRYAPDVIDLTELRRTAKNLASQEKRAAAAAARAGQPVPVARKAKDIFNDLLNTASLRNPGQFIDENGQIQNTAVFYGQVTDRVRMPDLAKAEALGIRQSMLQAFLGNNIGVQNLTDLWVAGTLLGPRFQLRSGLEDFGMYALTGGSLADWRAGRFLSTAVREASGQKLGIVKTAGRVAGDAADEAPVLGAMRSFLLPHLPPDKVRAALKGLESGERTPMIQLLKEATLRRRLMWSKDLDKRGLAFPARLIAPNSKQQRYSDYVSDLVRYSDNPFDSMAQVSETAAHLIDPSMPRARFLGVEDGTKRTMFIGGQPYSVAKADGGFDSRLWSKYNLDTPLGQADAHDDWLDNIILVMAKDGEKGRTAVRLVKDYHTALNKATPDATRVQAIVDELADVIRAGDQPYLTRMAHGQREGAEGLARRTLDAVHSMFVDDANRFNDDLYKKLVRKDADGNWSVRLTDNGEMRVTAEDLMAMDVKPLAVLTKTGLPVVIPEQQPWLRGLWDATGRSLARMTREPIFLGNYLDQREFLAPFQRAMGERFGDEFAAKWATEVAERRSVELSLSYVDNPAIRSQLAWNVRNVARFYRALEDFNRRMVRTMKNNPMAFWRIGLGWNILDDSGFVHEDEFGEKYFVWPGVNIAFNAMQDFMSVVFGRDMLSPGADMAFGSRVTMLTPSADPNSWTPTFSGPFAAFAIQPVLERLPGLRNLEATLFGEYSEDQDWWRTIAPPNVARAIDAMLTSAKSPEERELEAGTPFAKYARQAMQLYLASNPDWQTKVATDPEIGEIKRTIDMYAMDLLWWDFTVGFAAVARLQSTPDSVTDFARSLGTDGLREAFVETLRQYAGEPDGMSKAMNTWYRANPNLSIWTVGASGRNVEIGQWPTFRETVDYMEKYAPQIKENPLGFSYFAPQNGTDDAGLVVWKQLERMGARTPASVSEMFNQMVTQTGYMEYQILKSQYELLVAEGNPRAEAMWARARKDLNQRYPYLDSRLNGRLTDYQPSSKGDYQRDVEEVRAAAVYMSEQGNPMAQRYLDALSVYDSVLVLEQMDPASPEFDRKRDQYRENWVKRFIPQQLQQYGDDRKYKSFLYSLSKALVFEVDLGS